MVLQRVSIGAVIALLTVGSAQDRQSQLRPCGLEGFTRNPIEHIVNEIGPFSVKRVRGVIREPGGSGSNFGGQALLEVMGPKPSSVVLKVVIDKNGRFSVRDLPAGSYCFRAMAIGFQSVLGQLIVEPSGKESSIEITLKPGV